MDKDSSKELINSLKLLRPRHLPLVVTIGDRDLNAAVSHAPADIKEVKYQRYGAAEYAPYGGIKVFLDHDPDPLTEQQLMSMQPRPALIVDQ